MKRVFITLLCLLSLAVMVSGAEISVTLSPDQPKAMFLPENAIAPFIKVTVSAVQTTNSYNRWHLVFLGVQVSGRSILMGYTPPVRPILTKRIEPSLGPFEYNDYGIAMVGPINIEDGQTKEVLVSGITEKDLSGYEGEVSMSVIGFSIDAVRNTGAGLHGNFPLRGTDHVIRRNPPVGELNFFNPDHPQDIVKTVIKGFGSQLLGEFKVVVKTEPMTMDFLLLYVDFLHGSHAKDIVKVEIVDEAGKTVFGPQDVYAGEDYLSQHGSVSFYQEYTFPVGTNHYLIKGMVNNEVLDGETFSLSIREPFWSKGEESELIRPSDDHTFISPLLGNVITGKNLSPKLGEVSIRDSLDGLAVSMSLEIDPSASYSLEISNDLRAWSLLKVIEKGSGANFRDCIGVVEKRAYGQRAFFRLIKRD